MPAFVLIDMSASPWTITMRKFNDGSTYLPVASVVIGTDVLFATSNILTTAHQIVIFRIDSTFSFADKMCGMWTTDILDEDVTGYTTWNGATTSFANAGFDNPSPSTGTDIAVTILPARGFLQRSSFTE